MIHSSEFEQSNNINKSTSIIIILMAIFLNQSSVKFGVNISIADFLCVIIFILLLLKDKLILPFIPMMFFLFVSITGIITSAFIVPNKFLYNPVTYKIFIDYIKMVVVFIYFNIGYSVSNLKLIEKSLKWYSVFALLIGIIGIIFTVFKINIFSQYLFIGARFRGLMNDPNYFAIIQVSAFVYFSRAKEFKIFYKRLILLLLFMSILVSGSKTGIITMICYIFIRILEYLLKPKKKTSTFIIQSLLIVLLIIIVLISPNIINSLMDYTTSIIPTFARIRYLFTDFNSAISASGSVRDSTWKAAIEVIKASPIIGVGIGTYSGIASKISGIGAMAHNTYLQLFSEWGILLSTMFFIYIFSIIGKVSCNEGFKSEINLMLRDIVIVFLIGSLAVSLNNARMFWVFLGALTFNIRNNNIYN